MSVVDTARLIEIVSNPADSFSSSESPAPDMPRLVRRKLTWRFGKVTSDERITVVVVTTHEPIIGSDGSQTLYYEPRDCVIHVNGEPVHDYTALGLYSLVYDKQEPLRVQGLDLAARTLSAPLLSA